jgi:hypothetical protein
MPVHHKAQLNKDCFQIDDMNNTSGFFNDQQLFASGGASGYNDTLNQRLEPSNIQLAQNYFTCADIQPGEDFHATFKGPSQQTELKSDFARKLAG